MTEGLNSVSITIPNESNLLYTVLRNPMKPIKIKRTDKIIIGILAASITLAAILSVIHEMTKII